MSHRSIILATASYDSTIRLWEPQTGQCYKTIPYPDLHVNKIEITPDKCKVAAACNPNIQLFDLHSNYPHTPERTFRGHSWKSNNVMAVGFNNDGNMMYSGSEDGKIKIWDLRIQECQRVYGSVSDSKNKLKLDVSSLNDDQNVSICQKEYESGSAVGTIVLHPNQTELISGDQSGSVRLWDMRANSCRYELVPEIGTPITSLSAMSDGGTMVVAANNNGTCFIWNYIRGTQTEFQPLQKIRAHYNGCILKCLLSPQNKYLATASSDKTVKLWNVDDGFKLEKVLRGHQSWVWGCNFSVDGELLLTASSDMTARLWSMRTGNEVMVYRGHQRAIVSCALRD